ncbi:MAG: hypothetical protein ACOC93_01935 [Planctomycetota bacterium]
MGRKSPSRDQIRDSKSSACAVYLAQAEEHLAAERWVAARIALQKAKTVCVDRTQARQVQQGLVKVETEGQRRLAAAADLYRQEKYAEAIESWSRVANMFRGLPAGREALEALDKARTDPAAQTALANARALLLAERVEAILEENNLAQAARAATQPSEAPAGAAEPTTQPAVELSRVEQIKQLPPDG